MGEPKNMSQLDIAGNLFDNPVKFIRIFGGDVNATVVGIVWVCLFNKVEATIVEVLIVIFVNFSAFQAAAVILCLRTGTIAKSKVATVVQASHVGEVHVPALKIGAEYMAWNSFDNVTTSLG